MGQQVLLDLRRVGRRQVDLVDRHDHGHARVPGVADRLDRLRHHRVVGRHHQDHESVTSAPRARMAVKASCPGVSRKVTSLSPWTTTW